VVVQTDLVDEPIRQRDGQAYAPTRPGLGIEVDEAVVKALSLG
jgi:L-alanine-DL-glutamate epimerase-like enolase superfamily enzyme